jgi:hypothetical protein
LPRPSLTSPPPPPFSPSHPTTHTHTHPFPKQKTQPKSNIKTIINAATTKASSLFSGVWPYGLAHPLNNLFQRGWWGKVFYNDGSNPAVTQIWNLLYSNGTVDFDAIAYQNASTALTNDGTDSIFVDYATTDFAPFRTVIDEVRRVNADANIYLGHIWASNPADALERVAYKNRIDEVASKAKLAALNSTWLDFVGWAGLDTVGAASGAPAEYFTLGWFVMQCIGPKAPKLKYAWTAYFLSLINMLTGFYRPEAALPRLPWAPSSDPIEVGPGFPSPSHDAGSFPRLHIWPFKVRVGGEGWSVVGGGWVGGGLWDGDGCVRVQGMRGRGVEAPAHHLLFINSLSLSRLPSLYPTPTHTHPPVHPLLFSSSPFRSRTSARSAPTCPRSRRSRANRSWARPSCTPSPPRASTTGRTPASRTRRGRRRTWS